MNKFLISAALSIASLVPSVSAAAPANWVALEEGIKIDAANVLMKKTSSGVQVLSFFANISGTTQIFVQNVAVCSSKVGELARQDGNGFEKFQIDMRNLRAESHPYVKVAVAACLVHEAGDSVKR